MLNLSFNKRYNNLSIRVCLTLSLRSADNFGPRSGNVGPDLDPNGLRTLFVSLKEFSEKVNFRKKSTDNNKNTKN